ncbi:MAG: AraC family transcriptional regulator [Chitinophagaceae bacterium]|jgi:AraC-like DNA-binding protein|nr:MAG: AraC family transcriptional regulator [Chitinophagaceae bacterium]
MRPNLLHEITPLTENDCFLFFAREKETFDFPLHYHEEFEINFISHASGAQRIVGSHAAEIGDIELVLIGSNLPHVWLTHHCQSRKIEEITIQFHKDFLDDNFLARNQLLSIKRMFEESARGILFPETITLQIAPRIRGLTQKQGFEAVLELMSILHDLSIARNVRLLSDIPFNNRNESKFGASKKVQTALQYINENLGGTVTIKDIAKLLRMPEAPAGRFFKKHTGSTFKDILNDARVGNASRLLIDTTQSINEIAYTCGFNNLSYFNKLFKMKKDYTPKEFREKFSGTRIFI